MENKTILKRLKQYHALKFILSQKNVQEFMEREIRDNKFGYARVLTIFKDYVDQFGLIKVGRDREPIDKYVGRFVRNYKTLGDSIFSSNPTHDSYIDFLNAAFGWSNPADAPKNIQAIGEAIERDPALKRSLDEIHLAAGRSDGRTNIDILADSVMHIATNAGLRGNVSELERALAEQKVTARTQSEKQSIKIKDLLAEIKTLTDIARLNEGAVSDILKKTKKATGRATAATIAEVRKGFSIVGGRFDALDAAVAGVGGKVDDVHSTIKKRVKVAKKMNVGHIIHWIVTTLGTGAAIILLAILLGKTPSLPAGTQYESLLDDLKTYISAEGLELSDFRAELSRLGASGLDTAEVQTLEDKITGYAATDRNQDDPAYAAVTTTSQMRTDLNYAVLSHAYGQLEAENLMNSASAAELEAYKAYIAGENSEYSDFRTQYTSLAGDADGLTDADEVVLNDLITKYAATDDIATYGYSSTETMNLTLTNGVYERVIAGLNTEIAGYTAQVDALNAQIDGLKKQVETLQSNPDAATAEQIKALSAQIEALQETVDKLFTENDKLYQQIEALQEQLENANLSTEERAKLEAELAAAQQTILEKDQLLDEKEEELAGLKKANEELAAENAELKAENEELKIENAELKAEIESLKSEVDDLTSQVEELKSQDVVDKKTIDDLNAMIDSLNAEIDELEKELADAKANGSASSADLAAAQAEINRLKTELATALANVATLEVENASLASQVSTLTETVDELNGLIAELESLSQADSATITALNNAIDALEARVAELEDALDLAIENGTLTNAELIKAQQELEQAKKDLAEANKRAEDLAAENKALQDQNASLSAEVAELKGQVEDLNETINSLNASNADLANDLADALNQIDELEQVILKLEAQSDADAKALADAKAALEAANARIETLLKDAQALETIYKAIYGDPGNMTPEQIRAAVLEAMGYGYDDSSSNESGKDEKVYS